MGGWLAAWGCGRQKSAQNPPDFTPIGRVISNAILSNNMMLGVGFLIWNSFWAHLENRVKTLHEIIIT